MKKKLRKRVIFVVLFIIAFLIYSYIDIRGEYLQILGIGKKYVEIFKHNLEQRIYVFLISFFIIYLLTYITTLFIKKGLKKFFVEEKIEMPKLPNKSISFAFATIAGIIFSKILTEKAILAFNKTLFEQTEPIFNLDIGYYVFQKPFFQALLYSFIVVMVIMCIYITVYYILSFHKFFAQGINIETLKKNTFINQIITNTFFIIIAIALLAIIMAQDIVVGKFTGTVNGTALYGAGFIDVTLKKWGYLIFSVFIILCAIRSLIKCKKGKYRKACYNILLIPLYLVVMFVVVLLTDIIYLNPNELDKQKNYIETNIRFTKQAYDINIEEIDLENTGTITAEDIEKNIDVIDNINIYNKTRILSHLEEYQTNFGYYTFTSTQVGLYNINGKKTLAYISPREIISNETRTYNNKTYEYTHGYGTIISSASTTSETGALKYIESNFIDNNSAIKVVQPRIYFGIQTNEVIATNKNGNIEYDYPLTSTTNSYNTYDGQAGIKLGFFDRLVLGIKEKNVKLAFSTNITKESNIIIKRNILERAEKVMPYLEYDKNPYMIITDEGRLIWVIDAYTTSDSYPYSQVTNLYQENGTVKKINYIRNSVKVLIDSYDGTMKFYITDRTDPIIMAYWRMYPSLFEDLNEQIPEGTSKYFVYPKYLYNIQAEILKQYHQVQPEVLYRADDVWDTAKENTTKVSTLVGTDINPYYTMVKTVDNNEAILGLVLPYTINEKQNINAYLIGSCKENGEKELKLYKFNKDVAILGTLQLDTLIEQDEKISTELSAIEVMGTKIEKNIIVIPINNTLLYVEPIFQVLQNENKTAPILKKVIVASGNKVAIGNNIEEALTNLLSKEAVSIKIETDNIEDLIDEIIKANNNLTQSNQSNDWGLIGQDIDRLQTLITQLERLVEEEKSDEEGRENLIDQNTETTE